jgi:serine/threonine protein kinase
MLHAWDPPIAHRDLKLENFLLAQNGVYKLCDFGSCVDGPQSVKTKAERAIQSEHVDKRTTAMYRSPELADVEGTAMFGSGELTEAVDMWALGCVLYTMAFFKPPFPPEGLRTERYTIPKESPYSANLHQLIARMLQADVERRATIGHVMDCIDDLLEGKPLPKNEGAAAPPSPRKTGPPPKKAPTPASRESSFDKTAEARKESVPVAKAQKADLLDMDFNPTITTPSPVAAKAADPFAAGSAGGSAGWSGGPPTDPAFANFANFPTSPSKFGAAPSTAASSSFDAFGFPASPVKQPPSNGAFGFTSAPPPQTMPAADPFEGLSSGGGNPAMSGGYRPQPQFGRPPPPLHQGFQQMPQQQQQMWGQQQQQHYQQQPQQWGHQPQGGFPRGY